VIRARLPPRIDLYARILAKFPLLKFLQPRGRLDTLTRDSIPPGLARRTTAVREAENGFLKTVSQTFRRCVISTLERADNR